MIVSESTNRIPLHTISNWGIRDEYSQGFTKQQAILSFIP